MPQTTEPNQRIHTDLFEPLVTLERNKEYVLTMTDAFTKYVKLVAIPDKEAGTMAEALFEWRFCRYSIPLELVMDKVKEFCNWLYNYLMALLGTKHLTTTLYHPQCNSQAEVFNKKIAVYLSSFVN